MQSVFQNISFVLIYLLTITFITILLIKSGINLFKFNIPMYIYWSFLVFSYIGYPAIYFKKVPYYVNIGMTNQTIIWQMFIISSLVWIQLFFGISFGLKFIKGNNHLLIDKNSKKEISFLVWIMLFLISLFVFLYYLNSVPNVAIIEALKGASRIELYKFRSSMTNDFPNLHRYTLFFKEILPFLSFIALSQLLLKNKLKWKIAFFISFLITFFAMIADVQKAPLVWYIISLIAIYLVFNNKPVKFRLLIKIGFLILSLLVAMYILFMGESLSIKTILNPIQRATTGQIAYFYNYIIAIPERINYQGFKTFPNPGGILPYENFRYTVEIYKETLNTIDGRVASIPTGFYGELWVNGGWSLLFFTPMFFGIIISFIHKLFCARKLSSLGISFLVYLALDFGDLAITGYSNYFFPYDIIVIIIIIILFNSIEVIKCNIKKY